MPKADIRLDAGLDRRLLGHDKVRSRLEQLTGDIARRAAELAPDDPQTGKPDIRSGVDADVDHDDKGVMVGRVNAHDWKSGFWELGHTGPDGRTRQKAFLRPAAESAGFRVEDRR